MLPKKKRVTRADTKKAQAEVEVELQGKVGESLVLKKKRVHWNLQLDKNREKLRAGSLRREMSIRMS